MTVFLKIVDYVSAEPFLAFYIKINTGQLFEIRHPERILVGRRSVQVYFPPESDSEVGDRWKDVSLTLIQSVEPIGVASARSSDI